MDGLDLNEQKPNAVKIQLHRLQQRYQHILDKVTPHYYGRWVFTFLAFILYCVRVLWIQGFHIISYGLGIYLLSLFINFLSPRFDPAMSSEGDDTELPTISSDDFRPFVRRLPEFKFWLSGTKAVLISITCTLLPFLDIPVFWPILVIYFVFLFVVMMKKQIMHMIKYKYVPFDYGKPHHANSSSGSHKK